MLLQHISIHSSTLLLWGIIWHYCADWIFQNSWIADNKSNLLHPAAYIHSGLHLLGLLFIFPVDAAVFIALLHLLIDTRVPLKWWRRVFKQTVDGPVALHVAIWTDQVAHIMVIALVALLIG